MVEIIGVPREILDKVWEEVSPILVKALNKANGEMEIKDIYDYIKDDKYILLLAVEDGVIAAVTLEVQDYPKKKKLGVVHAAGTDLKKWLSPMWATIKDIAKDFQASSVVWTGREGWERLLKDEITKSYTIGEVEL